MRCDLETSAGLPVETYIEEEPEPEGKEVHRTKLHWTGTDREDPDTVQTTKH